MPFEDHYTAEELAAMERAGRSKANRELLAMLPKLEALKVVLGRWIDAHGDGCHCGFCSESEGRSEWIAENLAGLRWAIGVTVSVIEPATYGRS